MPTLDSNERNQLFRLLTDFLLRCLLAAPTVIVLDEALSSLDLQTEKRVLQLLLRELKDSTVITVAHRLQNITMFDRSD